AQAAAAVASGYLKRREAWQLGLATEDPAVYLARVVARSGGSSDAGRASASAGRSERDVRARRDAWYRAAAPTTAVQQAEVWALAYVLGVERKDEAAEALAAR